MGNNSCCCIRTKGSSSSSSNKKHKKKRRDNGDIFNHIEQIYPLNRQHDSYKLNSKLSTTALLANQSQTPQTPGISLGTPQSLYDNQHTTSGSYLYRSLKRSKRNIKVLEQTLKNSYSIENWLNEISTQQHDLNQNKLSIQKESVQLDDLINDKLKYFLKDTQNSKDIEVLVKDLIRLNNDLDKVNKIEYEFKEWIERQFLPKSVSYIDEIELLKCLFTQCKLKLCTPLYNYKLTNGKLINEQQFILYHDSDYLTYGQEIPKKYKNLNDKLFACLLSNYSCEASDNFIKKNLIGQAKYVRKCDNALIHIKQSIIQINKLKFCIKLDEWPETYDKSFFNRKRKTWPPNELLNSLDLLVNIDSNTLDFSIALSQLFNSLNEEKKFFYYLFYTIIKSTLNSNLIEINNFQLETIVLHHYLRYLELVDDEQGEDDHLNIFKCDLMDSLKIFLNYLLNEIILKYNGNLNLPNYFDFNQTILVTNAESDDTDVLFKLILNTLVTFNNSLKTTPSFSLSQITRTHQLSKNNHEIYDYILEFQNCLYDKFIQTKDNFEINENLLLELHKKLNVTYEFDLDETNLLKYYELYAEIVHKYLPQIRSLNQYLLFHYIWTMNVQFLSPFFNYITDNNNNNNQFK